MQLETLRDDLALYLKILRSAMIELINKDYADFVNLSTNLVGMDKAIGNLTLPLEQLREGVLGVRSAMNNAIVMVEEQLQKKRYINEKKACLERLMNIIQSVEKIERLLGIQNGSDKPVSSGGRLDGQLIERVATEFNKLQFNVTKSKSLPLVMQIKPRIANITSTLQHSLEGSFLEGLRNGNVEILCQCLRTYALIDKTRDAENLYRQHMVKPYMEKVIGETFMKSGKQGLLGMYTKIMEFIPLHFEPLRDITTSSSGVKSEVVRGYDFLVNAVWPEIVYNIEAKIPSIFAPGNPDVFHQKFTLTVQFLNRFEKECGSQASVKELRSHPSYNTFLTKWSLPVYFQIRFQEIAGWLESALLSPFDRNTESDPKLFHLHSTSTLWKCLQRCWADDVYLQPLCHRMWKLSIQLVTRYCFWMQEMYKEEMNVDKSDKQKPVIPSVNASVGPEGVISSETEGEIASIPKPVTIAQILCLLSDAEQLSEQLQTFFMTVIAKKLEDLRLQNVEDFRACIKDCATDIVCQLPKIQAYVIKDVISQCTVHLKQVNDIPRLYRRTNREVPSKPSAYILSLLDPLKTFTKEHQEILLDSQKNDVYKCAFSSITEQFFSVTSDVLTSVKKMEDSLKRLKRGRASEKTSHGFSDDDKIRLQLVLDIKAFEEQVHSFGIGKDCLPNIEQLLTLAEDAKAAMTS